MLDLSMLWLVSHVLKHIKQLGRMKPSYETVLAQIKHHSAAVQEETEEHLWRQRLA